MKSQNIKFCNQMTRMKFVNNKTGLLFKPFKVTAAIPRFADYFRIFRAAMKPLRKFQ